MPMMDIDRAAYDALPGHNWSKLKHALKSAKSYKANKDKPFEDSDTLKMGRVFHHALLEPHLLGSEVIVYEDRRAGKEWKAFEAAHKGKEIVKPDELADAVAMAKAIHSTPEIVPMLAGRYELTAQWEMNGHLCKGRIDILSNSGGLIDPKSTQDCGEKFAASVERFGYLGQLAWYFDGLRACGESPLFAALLAIEKTAPYEHVLYVMSDEDLDAGRALYAKALDIVTRAEWNDEWPGMKPVQQFRRSRWAVNATIEGDDNG